VEVAGLLVAAKLPEDVADAGLVQSLARRVCVQEPRHRRRVPRHHARTDEELQAAARVGVEAREARPQPPLQHSRRRQQRSVNTLHATTTQAQRSTQDATDAIVHNNTCS
jgi:hypothetical protein